MTFEQTDIKYLKGVGPARAALLADELDIHTFGDLLGYFPFRHLDRSRFYAISDLGENMPAVQVKGRFVGFSFEGEGARRRLSGTFTDGKMLMSVVWFSKVDNIAKMYHTGVDYVLFGSPKIYRGNVSMVHPEIETYDPERPPTGLRGVYSLTETLRKRGLSTRVIQTAVGNLLRHPGFANLSESLPAEICERLRLMPRAQAIAAMHFPSSAHDLQKATERMKFEELFYLELHILLYSKRRNASIVGRVFPRIGDAFNSFFFKVLPFPLTGAQKRVMREIRSDMATGRQMNRLLQGDVGCGKTLVAFMSMLIAVDNGCQAVLMAPTEILATQHHETLTGWAGTLGLRVELLTGSTRAGKRRDIHAGLLSGDVNILVGTHALLEDKVEFRDLGLAVIDEQHRFGVAQRARLWTKNEMPPHMLVMTATPIPRTLAMTVYGDLEVSVIDELPPGRKPVATYLRSDESRMEVDRLIFSQLREGRQIYIVYPLVKENEKLDLKSLQEGFKRTQEVFADYSVCFVHGQMKPAEKDHQMELFVSGEARIMVATTVIEVGVNVPNASVMVIENAERFGLSQLHQLRGRVGRGADRSYCVLMSKSRLGADTRRRLEIMTETSDGFLISEADMQMRGPGDIEGTQQSGLAVNLRVANLARDGQIVSLARSMARSAIDSNPVMTGGTQEGEKPVTTLVLSHGSLALLSRELTSRFASSFDWSQIS